MLWLLIGCAHIGIPMPGKVHHFSESPNPIAKASSNEIIPEVVEPHIETGEQVAEIALALRGQNELVVNGTAFRFDCSGFVLAAYTLADIELSGNTRSLFEQASNSERLSSAPSIGDMVFFDNTYDRNKNGRLDDSLSHIAIVVGIDADGTIHMVHLGGSGITDLTMNLQHASTHKSPGGKVWNSYLRINKKGEKSPRLTGQLYRSFASVPAE